jgi:hypothetical protein
MCKKKTEILHLHKYADPLLSTLLKHLRQRLQACCGGKSTQLSYLSKSKYTLVENDSSKSESHPVKYYLSKSQKVFGF